MPNRKGARNAYYYFALHRLPELRRLGLPVARVVDAIPYCSQDWAVSADGPWEGGALPVEAPGQVWPPDGHGPLGL